MELEEELYDHWIGEWSELAVTALHDGDAVSPWETVAHVEGRYSSFAHLESVYLGVLARRTLVATNTRRVVAASNGKRSEERRVGKEGVSTCRSRGAQLYQKKKDTK